MKRLSAKGEKVFEIIIIVTLVTVAILFWDTSFVFPIKLFVVLLHEISHCIAVLISGGTVKEIQVSYQLGGSCISQGGNEIAAALAGYLGSLVFGVLIFISARKEKVCKFVCCFVALVFIAVAIFFIKSLFGILFSIGFAIVLILLSLLSINFIRTSFIKTLGLLSCLYIIFDIKDDLLSFEYRDTDALILEKITSIPSILWGIAILLFSLIIIYYMLKKDIKKYRTREE